MSRMQKLHIYSMLNDLLILFAALEFVAADLRCYYPDSTEATGHIPCNATASDTHTDASACCFGYGNDYCLANGLCWFDGILSRGFCTDINWASSACPQYCQEEQRNTSMNIFPCHQQGTWQCEWHTDCSTNFTLQTPEIAIIIRDGQQPNAPNAIQFADPNAKFVAANSTNSASTITNSASTLTNSASTLTNSNATSLATATGNTDPCTKNVTKVVHKGISPLAVGLGVGVPLGVLLSACLALLLTQHRRPRRELHPTLAPNSVPSITQHNQWSPKSRLAEMSDSGPAPELQASVHQSHELASSSPYAAQI